VVLASMLPNSPRRQVARRDVGLSWRLTALVGWSGLRGAVSLAAALALPETFPERNLILLVTFGVILVTLVGQGLTLPLVIRWVHWDGMEDGDNELERGRAAIYEAGLGAIEAQRPRWPGHQPLLDRMEEAIHDRQEHLPTEDPDETAERRTEQLEHREIRLAVVAVQRLAVNALRDDGVINDATLRTLERELDLDELQTEA
jgi:monovalent cation/hydrogen antiporter